ncbi:MAG TPA: hypothetical protein DCP78_22300 [Sphingobacterium sp.]|nr:hypothetical protein [Sphingobacterium sp.]
MDRYSRTARLYPMIIFYLPLIVVGALVTFWDLDKNIHFTVPFGAMGVLAYFAAQIGRDGGKRKEKKLWEDWGGAPTTQLFRWSDGHFDRHTKGRNHQKMHSLCPVGHLTDEPYERSNTILVDEAYRAWTSHIISNARGTKKYPRIFRVKMAYGFRRNLWGLKPVSIILIGILALATYGFLGFKAGVWTVETYPQVFFISEGFLLLCLVCWLFIIRKNWIKIPAFAYAERLHEAIGQL